MQSEKEFIKELKKHVDYPLDYWNPEKFNWEYSSWVLAKHCSKYFTIWWNTDKFNWQEYSFHLTAYCSEFFNKWWDAEKFDWEYSSWALARHCSDYFNIWWNADKFNWCDKDAVNMLNSQFEIRLEKKEKNKKMF